jgi:hypothetical protein
LLGLLGLFIADVIAVAADAAAVDTAATAFATASAIASYSNEMGICLLIILIICFFAVPPKWATAH